MTTTRPAPFAVLDKIARHTDAALKAARCAEVLATIPGRGEETRAYAEKAGDESAHAQTALLAAGASLHALPQPSSIDLLALDTPDNRELLFLLDAALAVAERVDASRGRSLPAHIPTAPGESRGCDLAESLAEVAARVRQEVHGANSRFE